MGDVIRAALGLPWVQAVAQRLPFAGGSFAAAYSTSAFFFPVLSDIDLGYAEALRVLRPGAPLLIVDTAGGEEARRLLAFYFPDSARAAA